MSLLQLNPASLQDLFGVIDIGTIWLQIAFAVTQLWRNFAAASNYKTSFSGTLSSHSECFKSSAVQVKLKMTSIL